jgi:hypothetical protein
MGVDERQHSFEGRICRRSARLHGVLVDKATVKSDKNIFMAKIRRDRKAASEKASIQSDGRCESTSDRVRGLQ